ncbi:uncharacterized protein KGF55_000824 [Candida pseudojiufengensis]|uniref:uncharacterized protein n=1 Tax=Candida pseudojiufengensis TaxID=497109 RepID=UPI002224F58E|nr:uncharacterized protein KGF55_000824 [Candida pseudojiufengensis]KAI5966515.1 hypothetical protein KGF55_000824 [Candida pseudojiufengensis]
MSKTAHNTAVNSFNSNHSSYDVFRPSFNPILVNPFLVDLGLAEVIGDKFKFKTDKKIVEIACGTGKFTKNLIENGWTTNLTVIEPSSGMLTTFQKNFPQIKNVIQASSYEIPLQDNSVDAVIIAQGFHWFADDESLKEINRILKPGSKLGLIWHFDYCSPSQNSNAEDSKFFNDGSRYFNSFEKIGNNEKLFEKFFANQKWNEEVTKYIYGFDVNVPQYRHGKWRKVLLESKYFKNDTKDSFALYDRLISKEDVWKYWETRSYITDLSDEKKEEIKYKLFSIIDANVNENSYDPNTKLLIKPMVLHAVVVTVNK